MQKLCEKEKSQMSSIMQSYKTEGDKLVDKKDKEIESLKQKLKQEKENSKKEVGNSSVLDIYHTLLKLLYSSCLFSSPIGRYRKSYCTTMGIGIFAASVLAKCESFALKIFMW